jgi:hypothetical protein
MAVRLGGLDDGAVHAICGLLGEPYGDINEPGSSQPVEVFGSG